MEHRTWLQKQLIVSNIDWLRGTALYADKDMVTP